MGMSAMGAVPGMAGAGIVGAGAYSVLGMIPGLGGSLPGMGAATARGNLDPLSQGALGVFRGGGAAYGSLMRGAGMREAGGAMLGGGGSERGSSGEVATTEEAVRLMSGAQAKYEAGADSYEAIGLERD